MTASATRKRVYSKQSEMSPSWRNSPFAPFTNFGSANGSEMMTPPFEKRLRTEKKTVSTFKWEPDVPGNTQFSAGYGFRDIKVRTPLPAAWQEQPSRGYSTPPQVRLTREKYEGVKQELIQRSSWFAKLDSSALLAEDALDRVGRPRIGLNFTVGPTQSYYQKYVDAKRELEDFKRVAHAVNSWVPLSSNGKSTAFSSLQRMRRRGSNLQQGPMNLYDIQDVLAKKSQRGGGHSNLGDGTSNGELLTRIRHEDAARPNEELQASGSGPESSSQPVAASIEMLDDDDDEAHVPKDDKVKKTWELLKENALNPAWKAREVSILVEIGFVEEKLSRMRIEREETKVRCQKEREASKKEEVVCRLSLVLSLHREVLQFVSLVSKFDHV